MANSVSHLGLFYSWTNFQRPWKERQVTCIWFVLYLYMIRLISSWVYRTSHMYFLYYVSYWRATISATVYSTFNITRNKSIRIREGYYYNHFPKEFAGALVFTMTTGLIPLNITKPSVGGLLNAHQTTVIVCQWHYCLLCHHATILLALWENREICPIVEGSKSYGWNIIFFVYCTSFLHLFLWNYHYE